MNGDSARPYRLVWFQHFHKAGGTTIIRTALANGETPYPQHRNGNPLRGDGRELPIWDYDDRALTAFVDDCERRGITFVASEWGTPLLSVLAADPRVRLVTCLREPLSRFVSNYYFDLYAGYTPARSLEQYVGSRGRTITSPDYYCRMLARIYNRPEPLTSAEAECARQALDVFASVSLLGQGFAPLGEALGWRIDEIRENADQFGPRKLAAMLRRGQFERLWLRFAQPRKPADAAFAERFARLNAHDLALYEHARRRWG